MLTRYDFQPPTEVYSKIILVIKMIIKDNDLKKEIERELGSELPSEQWKWLEDQTPPT